MLKKMHNKKLCNTYSSPNITVDELTGNVAWIRRMRNAYTILVVKPEGKRPLGRLWCRLENNIKRSRVLGGRCELDSSKTG
jgi:hypothetical protein